MPVNLERLDFTSPRQLTLEIFRDGRSADVSGRAMVHDLDGVFDFGEVFAHASIISTRSATVHAELITPASTAGAQRTVMCVFTKL